MWAIALRFEKAATLQHDHAHREEEECGTPPINFFHSKRVFTFTKANVAVTAQTKRNFNPETSRAEKTP
jgi:hypothetical protein